jgi:predicted dehydrogenase
VIKTAVIGVGYLGQFHAEKYAYSKKAELVAVVDVSEEKAKKVAKKLRTKAYADYTMLTELGVQCASIAADTGEHYRIASWMLDHGIDVLVEKPMTTTVEEARDLIARAERNGRVLQVGHLERFNPAFRAMEKVLTRPWFFEVRRIAPFAGRGHDVDVILDLMIHDIDIIAHLVKRPLQRVEAVGVPVLTGTVDIANARLTFEGGAIANVSASRAAFQSERTIRIFQPELYISLDYGKKKLKMYSKSGGVDSLGFPKISVEEKNVEERDALADEIDAFLEAVAQRSAPLVSGWDGLRAIELAEIIRKEIEKSTVLLNQEEAPRAKVGNAGD